MNTNAVRRIGRVSTFLLAYCLCFFSVRGLASKAQETQSYHLVKKILLGGEGKWDYLTLDSVARRLYITRGTRVSVLNVDTGSVVGEIPDTAGVHGVALAPELGRGFTSNGSTSTATIFDLKTLQVLGQVKTGLNPDAIVYDPFSQRVFTFNAQSNSATVFDAQSAQVVDTIELDGRPEFAITDGLGQIYVNLESKSEVLTIDTRRLTVKGRSSLAPCSEPTGIAMDKLHQRLFIGCHNRMMAVVDADSGGIKAILPIGSGVDAIAFEPSTELAFSSNGEGTVTVVHEDSIDKFRVVDTIVTQRGARTMALDTQTHNIFLTTADFEPTATTTSGEQLVKPKIVPGTFRVLILGHS